MKWVVEMKRTIWCLLLILLSVGAAEAKSSSLDVNRRVRPYTISLPRIDKVELERYKTVEMRIDSIEATKVIEGREAQAIAALWRAQNYRWRTPICHYPAFGIKFYSKGKLILYASLCWQCDNIIFREPRLGVMQGFNGSSRKGKQLLEVFLKAFPR